MRIRQQALEYRCGDVRFTGRLFFDEACECPQPGVLVFPEAFGLNAHAAERAERLAQLGYVALAVDPHGEGRVFADLPSLAPSIKALYADRLQWRARALAALDALSAQPQVDRSRVAAIGFCFGGATCFELARCGAPLTAIVSFHGGLLPQLPEDAGRIRARVLICHGDTDPVVKPEVLEAVLQELRHDAVDWQLLRLGGATHSFTDPAVDARDMPGVRYHALADARAWAAMRGLLSEVFDV